MNCLVVPLAMLGFVGAISIEMSIAGVTESAVEPVTPPTVAVIVADPADAETADPLASTAAIDVDDELQAAVAVRSWVVPSE